MPKITYLLGAGASANALPLIKKAKQPAAGFSVFPPNKPGLPEELVQFVQKYKNSALSKTTLVIALDEITRKCMEFETPDLLAKFLLETGDNKNYMLLKRLLSNYFSEQQSGVGPGRKQAFDFRALTFLTTISANSKLPENVKILSWNYDRQLEIAAEKLKPVNAQSRSKIKNFNPWPNYRDGVEGEHFRGIPFLLHLNGIAGYKYTAAAGAEEDASIFNFDDNMDPMISFAWEDESNDSKNTFNSKRIQHLQSIAANTEILVVVGYSFPFFNRKIDDEIFKSARSSLSKIYFQDPNLDGNQLINQFDLSPKLAQNLKHIREVDNYYVPFEL